MSRPLLITDCDEVLLHMVRHFGAWLDEAHGITFRPEGGRFTDALTWNDGRGRVPEAEVWPLLAGFFPKEMDRQTAVPGAIDALARIGSVADIVVLTNLGEGCHAARVSQLARHGVSHRVVCNQGGKGTPVARLIEEFRAPVAVFVDDLPIHHASVAKDAPAVWRLHMVAEPSIARGIAPAPDAHARIDDWDEAVGWVLDRFAEGRPADRAGDPDAAGILERTSE